MAFIKDYMMQHKSMTSNLIRDDLDEPIIDINVNESEVLNFEEYDITRDLDSDINVGEEVDKEQSPSSPEFKNPKKKIKKSWQVR